MDHPIVSAKVLLFCDIPKDFQTFFIKKCKNNLKTCLLKINRIIFVSYNIKKLNDNDTTVSKNYH